MLRTSLLPSGSNTLPTIVLITACAACGGAAPEAGTDGMTPTPTSDGEPITADVTEGDDAGSEPVTTTTGETETSGTTAPDTTGADDVEDPPPPVCGDGRVDPGEQCDNGETLNNEHKFCTDACKLNICGDGLLFDGHEDCDLGAVNSDEYGSICTEQCEPGVWCGDNIVQMGHEECDNGPDNGTPAPDEEGISCDTMCRMNARRVFITSHAYTGNLGGLSGADEKCRKAAADAELPHPERFMALLSDAGTSMKSRYEDKLDEQLPYVFVTGKKVSDSYAELIKGGPGDLGLYLNEEMEIVSQWYVASNTAPGGSIYQEFDDQNVLKATDCDGWWSDSKQVLGRLGLNSKSADDPDFLVWKEENGWLSSVTMTCNKPMRLYCIEL